MQPISEVPRFGIESFRSSRQAARLLSCSCICPCYRFLHAGYFPYGPPFARPQEGKAGF